MWVDEEDCKQLGLMMEKEGLNINNKPNKSMTHFILLPSNKQMDGRSEVSDDDIDL